MPSITAVKTRWITEGEIDHLSVITWREDVIVQVDTVAMSVGEVLTALGAPQIGDTHPRYSQAKIRTIRPRRKEGLYLYTFEVEYSTEPDQVENPLAVPLKLDWGDEIIQEAAEFDDDGFYLTPSTGLEMFDPLPLRDVFVEVLTIQRNVTLWDTPRRDFLRPYRGAVNLDTFYGAAAGWVRCISITGSPQVLNGFNYTQETYKFLFRAPKLLGAKVVDGDDPPATKDILGWDDAFADLGTFYLDSSDNQIPFEVHNGSSRSSLGILDGQGGKSTTGSPVYLRYKLKKTKEFAPLDLGGS